LRRLQVKNLDFIVLGAGPAGLAYARARDVLGERDFVVLDKESSPGGLCRSKETRWGTADVGGGHMWCTRHRAAEEFVFSHLPRDEWEEHERSSTVMLMGHEIGYPVEESLWELPEDLAVRAVMDVLRAWRSAREEENFEGWIRSRFGETLSREYMLPYNRKLWGPRLDRMGLDWLHKLPGEDVERVVSSIVRRGRDEEAIFHRKWLYPKRGGFQAMTDALAAPILDRVALQSPVDRIEMLAGGCVVNGEYKAPRIVNTIPWAYWMTATDLPDEVCAAAWTLESVPLAVELVEPSPGSDGVQWTYYPDEKVPFHRKFFSSGWMPRAQFDFTETNQRRFEGTGLTHFSSSHAYPVPHLDRPRDMGVMLDWASSVGVTPLGRWGTWRYENSDVFIQESLETAAAESSLRPEDVIARIRT
jgi:protoporphyrinogen oxidase